MYTFRSFSFAPSSTRWLTPVQSSQFGIFLCLSKEIGFNQCHIFSKVIPCLECRQDCLVQFLSNSSTAAVLVGCPVCYDYRRHQGTPLLFEFVHLSKLILILCCSCSGAVGCLVGSDRSSVGTYRGLCFGIGQCGRGSSAGSRRWSGLGRWFIRFRHGPRDVSERL